jgi:hypothetical protein
VPLDPQALRNLNHPWELGPGPAPL